MLSANATVVIIPKEFSLVRKALYLLSAKEKRRGLLVMFMAIIMAGLEMVGVASIMPFLSVLGNPQAVETNPVLSWVYNAFGFPSVDAFLMALGATAFGLLLFSALFKTLTNYAMNRYIEMRRHTMGERLLETYLRQPYVFFLDRHSGDMAKNILSEVDQVIGTVFRPGLQMIAFSTVVLALIVLLIVVDPVIAAVVGLSLGGVYALVYWGVRGVLGRIGAERARANQERFEAAGEALGGIKDIKLLGREHAYLTRFHRPSVIQARHQATTQTLSQVPKFVIEAIAFGGIIALTIFLMASRGGAGSEALGDVLPVLGIYAFAAYRMLPAVQQIYASMAKLRFGEASVDKIYDDLRRREGLAEIRKFVPDPMKPRDVVRLDRVSFAYPNTTAPAIQSIHLDIPVGSSVGLVGSTGAGKTTLVDLFLGLLRPTEGAIIVDGEPITDRNLRAWQQALGYVPQDIFLTDSTVAENIALGVAAADIDFEHVERCARMAQVHDFIMQEMPRKYSTVVGERGVRLSGGQRQRIGIARALYHDPGVLVFDEATSALDVVTERAVMAAINQLHHDKTIIMIAHRLSTVRSCDQVVLLEKGRVVGAGTYEELQESNERFRNMAAAKA